MSIIIKNTIFTGKFLLQLQEIDSTNNYAHNWIANNEPIDGTVIIADHQTAGRGQFGNIWKTSAGQNLTFSIIYLPKFLLAKDAFYLNMSISLGISNGLKQYFPALDVKIKWPNDIYIGDKKVAGILIENSISGNYLKSSIVGIGLNVLQTEFDPKLPNPTSLLLENKSQIELQDSLNIILVKIEQEYLVLRSGNFSAILASYNEILFRKGISADYMIPSINTNNKFTGKIIGVARDGKLEIEFNDGNKKFYFKEIEYVI